MVLTNNSCNETLSPLVRLVDVKNIINKTDVPAGDYHIDGQSYETSTLRQLLLINSKKVE